MGLVPTCLVEGQPFLKDTDRQKFSPINQHKSDSDMSFNCSLSRRNIKSIQYIRICVVCASATCENRSSCSGVCYDYWPQNVTRAAQQIGTDVSEYTARLYLEGEGNNIIQHAGSYVPTTWSQSEETSTHRLQQN